VKLQKGSQSGMGFVSIFVNQISVLFMSGFYIFTANYFFDQIIDFR